MTKGMKMHNGPRKEYGRSVRFQRLDREESVGAEFIDVDHVRGPVKLGWKAPVENSLALAKLLASEERLVFCV